MLTGGADAYYFTFKKVADSAEGRCRDIILDFTRAQGDKIDFAAIDANTHVAGNNAFHFIGAAAFITSPVSSAAQAASSGPTSLAMRSRTSKSTST